MGVLLSLLFVCGFVNTRWVNTINIILKKKPGRNKIHMTQIIGKVSVEFNTIMKYYSKLAVHNCEKSSPSNGQWGGKNYRSPIDTAMIKLLAYESTRMNKDTMVIMNYDVTADFERMYHGYVNMFDARKKLTVRYTSACQRQ